MLSPEDMDLEISRSARELAAVGDVETLASALQAAHPNPIVQIEMPGQQLAELLRDDRVAFYRIDLIDIIDEDGDVVRVYVNDAPYATVPLLNAGTTVIVPIAPGGATRVSLAGIADGAGGITLGCRTSQGTVTCQPLRVGDYVPLDIVLP